MKIQFALLLTLLSPAGAVLAQTPASPPSHSTTHAVDPVGTYDVSFVSHGEPGTGVLIISGTGGSFKGTLQAHGRSISLTTITIAGRNVTLRDTEDLSITLTFGENGRVTGKWSGHNDSGNLTAIRRS